MGRSGLTLHGKPPRLKKENLVFLPIIAKQGDISRLSPGQLAAGIEDRPRRLFKILLLEDKSSALHNDIEPFFRS